VDNFTLTYNPDITGSVITIADDNATLVDVYSTTGIRLRHNVDAASATAGLTPGIYIVGHRKVAVK
jgi:hypothetical protein